MHVTAPTMGTQHMLLVESWQLPECRGRYVSPMNDYTLMSTTGSSFVRINCVTLVRDFSDTQGSSAFDAASDT